MSLDITLYLALYDSEGNPVHTDCVGDFNVTHNLNRMAKAGGFYLQLWGYDERIKLARDLEPYIRCGLASLKEMPEVYKKYDAYNGWGVYDDFVNFLEKLLECLEKNPIANISFSR